MTIQFAKTTQIINAPISDVWKKVGFYEHVNTRPSLLLRTILPVPIKVDGKHETVGDICRCRYSDRGYLTKKITRVEHKHLVEFDIIEQSIRYQSNILLKGGCIEVNSIDSESTQISMKTCYQNKLFPWLGSHVAIQAVIKEMHRFVIDDMRYQLEPSNLNLGESAGLV